MAAPQVPQDNPYKTPNATVADAPLLPLSAMPPQVRLAIRMQWSCFALALLQLLPNVSPLLWAPFSPSQMIVVIVISLFLLGLQALVVWKCSRGKRWARTVVAVLLPLSLCIVAESLFVSREQMTALYLTLLLAGSALDIGSVWLLFMRPAREWFAQSDPRS